MRTPRRLTLLARTGKTGGQTIPFKDESLYLLPESHRVVCLGGAAIDRKYHAAGTVERGTSNPVSGSRTFGGVARNVCENLARLGVKTQFISVVGNDEAGRALVGHLDSLGVDTTGTIVDAHASTAEYVAIVDADSSLFVGVADMEIFDVFEASFLESVWPKLAAASWVFSDCNPSAAFLGQLIGRAGSARFRLAVDAVSSPKAKRLPHDLKGIDVLFLNLDEALALLGGGALSAQECVLALCARGADQVVLTLGCQGALVGTIDGVVACAAVTSDPVDVTGVGDALIAGTLAGLQSGQELFEAVRIGCLVAAMTIEHEASVHPDLSPELLARAVSWVYPQLGGIDVR